MTQDAWLVEIYFDWLRKEAFGTEERENYEGALRCLHDIPFYWTKWLDENRAGDALAFRQSDFLAFQMNLDQLDEQWLGAWAMQSPSVLEVLLGMARRWSFYYEADVSYFFGHMFKNLGLGRYGGHQLAPRAQNNIRVKLDNWMSGQFEPNGKGSPFPLKHYDGLIDMRLADIWTQMNMYSAEHFQ